MLHKLEKFLFYILVFSIPFQTRVILRSWGIGFNEWNAAFFYWTDLLILAVLGFWFLRFLLKKAKFSFSNYDWFLVGFLIISAISIKNAINPALGWYQFFKLTEFSFFYFYIKSEFNLENLRTAFAVFLASGFFQAALAVTQYVRQADLGLRFLGETVLNPDLFNVATFLVNGEKIMRPYGTTPHPNVLALILFVAIFVFYIYSSNKSKIGLFIYGAILFGLFLTFSRIIIFAWLIGVILLIRRIDKRTVLATIVVVLVFSVLFWPHILTRLNISGEEEAVALRGFYNKISLFEKPFWGVGTGNFVNWLKETNPGLAQNLYQPVHNIYLFIFSETGILGLAAFLLFLFFLAKNYLFLKFNHPFHLSLFIIFLSLLFFGLFDHFLLTIQQGRIVFWLVLALVSFVPIAQQDRAQASGA